MNAIAGPSTPPHRRELESPESSPERDFATLPKINFQASARRRVLGSKKALSFTPTPVKRCLAESTKLIESSGAELGQQASPEVDLVTALAAISLSPSRSSTETSPDLPSTELLDILDVEDPEGQICSSPSHFIPLSPSSPQASGLLEHAYSPTSPPPARQVIEISDESDDEDLIWRKTPRTPRRKIVITDSESEASPSRIATSPSPSQTGHTRQKPKPKVKTTTPRRVLKFLDTMAMADDDSEEEPDDSIGSLRDFIVDDDEIEYASDASEGDREYFGNGSECSDSSVEIVSRPKPITKPSRTLLDITNLTLDSPPSSPEPVVPTKLKPGKWAIERVRLAEEVFNDLDKRVFESKLGNRGAGAKLEWSKRLLTTAGTASNIRTTQPDGTKKSQPKITLSEKVCTGKEQILSTVAHEMCHLACWVISNEYKNPHGRIFKSWGRKVMRARSDIEVTTKHSYEIQYKYEWKCVDCLKVYRRHSKSIDIESKACGVCRGRLQPLFETKSSSAFQVYLKQNMAHAKAALPRQTHGEVMRALSKRWTDGQGEDHEAFWRAAAVAVRS